MTNLLEEHRIFQRGGHFTQPADRPGEVVVAVALDRLLQRISVHRKRIRSHPAQRIRKYPEWRAVVSCERPILPNNNTSGATSRTAVGRIDEGLVSALAELEQCGGASEQTARANALAAMAARDGNGCTGGTEPDAMSPEALTELIEQIIDDVEAIGSGCVSAAALQC